MSDFLHLHGHSFHSNGTQPDALSSPEEIVKIAKEKGMPAIALTDHGSISGIPSFAKAAKEHGIKGIAGSELYVTKDPSWRAQKGEKRRDYSHCVALAKNWAGFEELCKLLSQASSAEQFYGRPRNSYDQLAQTENLIFLTACGGGILAQDDHECILSDLKAAVGKERLYVELQPHNDDRQKVVNSRAVDMSKTLDLGLVSTQDYHYAMPGDNITHEILLAIGTRDVWSNPDRWKYPVDDLFMKTKAEMVKGFMPQIHDGIVTVQQVADSFANNEKIASELNFEWQNLPVSLPDMGPRPDKQLADLCVAGLKRIGKYGVPEYQQRLVTEFKVIQECGFLSYFLVLREIIAWSRENGIAVGPGRGSSGGSLVCYLIGITQIDPIRHGLLFERFYRPGRVDLPDIDSDFEDERREEVIDYISNRFGDDRVSSVATYNTLGAKGAIKDVARVFEINHMEANAATAQVDDGLPAADVFNHGAIKAFLAKYPAVEPHAKRLVGWMRGTGQHAAGVVIAGVPLSERAHVIRKDARAVVSWDKDTIEGLGLMKLDVLGLRTMTILRHAVENVWKRRAKKIDLEQIPLDDPRTLEMFDRADTTGVFQMESAGMRRVLKDVNVDV